MKRLLAVLALAGSCAASAQFISEKPPAPLSGLPRSEVLVETADGRHVFQVWIADNNQSRQQGLMFIKELPADQGMLFSGIGADNKDDAGLVEAGDRVGHCPGTECFGQAGYG